MQDWLHLHGIIIFFLFRNTMSWHVLIILCHNTDSANVPSQKRPLLLPKEATLGVGRCSCCTEITKTEKDHLRGGCSASMDNRCMSLCERVRVIMEGARAVLQDAQDGARVLRKRKMQL